MSLYSLLPISFKQIFISSHWGSSLMTLVDLLGPEYVFISVHENDSGRDTIPQKGMSSASHEPHLSQLP